MTQDIDWNLLNALDVLLAEGSVTAASERLHLSVPATSRTLGRIRRAFGDPILVRSGRGLVPTPRALAVQEQLHRLIEDAHALVESGRDLHLSSLERTFAIRANDALISALPARLIDRVQTQAPGVAFRFVAEGEEDVGPLRDGSIDLDLGQIADFGPDVRVSPLYQETYLGVVAADNKLAKGRVTLKRLASVGHVAVSRRGRRTGALDDVLAEHGLARTVVTVVPTFTAAAHIIASSELTGMLPARYALQIAGLTGMHPYPIPAELPSLQISQAWHVRQDLDPAHQWLRGQIAEVLADPQKTA
jgi:DNA-binding transcriptional LysR family regulator